MREIKLTIDGKEVPLTEEQLKTLGIDTPKNPFERVAKGSVYYKITEYGNIDDYTEDGDYTDQNLYDSINYFNDDSVAQQIALHQMLYRMLLKFAYDNEFEDTAEWDGFNKHWTILYHYENNMVTIDWMKTVKNYGVYFSSCEGAKRAIKEVIEPFMKEHPDFVW